MMLKFSKMHGLGNDFMVIDGVGQKVSLTPEIIRLWGDRHLGVGFDQLLLVEPSTSPQVDFNYRIFNADGSEVGQCGNGARCLASFIHERGLSNKRNLCVKTQTTIMQLHLELDDSVSVAFAAPKFAPKDIPMLAHTQVDKYNLSLPNNDSVAVHVVNVGNPHAIMLVENLSDNVVTKLGPIISQHILFPEQINANFMQIIDDSSIKLRVFERGCGETLACGSGALASAVIAMQFYGLKSPVKVSLPGGDLNVTWSPKSSTILLNGPTCMVYSGEI